jgi:hypothetical protein
MIQVHIITPLYGKLDILNVDKPVTTNVSPDASPIIVFPFIVIFPLSVKLCVVIVLNVAVPVNVGLALSALFVSNVAILAFAVDNPDVNVDIELSNDENLVGTFVPFIMTS